MKNSLKTALFAAAAGAFALAPLSAVQAQEAVKTTTAVSPNGVVSTQTTTSEGTIQEYTPGASRIIVKTAAGPATYSYSKQTTFVDASGNVVTAESIRAGEPTTVYYTMEAGQPVVSKVVVRRTAVVAPVAPVTKTETTETTTTTSSTSKH